MRTGTMLPDFVQYDPGAETLTIDGIRFARELFRCFATDEIGTIVRIIARERGTVSFERLFAKPNGASIDRARLAELTAKEIARQGNEIDNLGDGESVCLTGPLPTINLVELVEKILAAINPGEEAAAHG